MKKNRVLILVFTMAIVLACSASWQSLPAVTATPILAATSTGFLPTTTLTPVSTLTSIPRAIVLDFAAQLCNAKWANGGQEFAACPDANSDHSAGYAAVLNPASEGLPANTPVILTIPAWNGYAALFLRYPALKVQAGDHFRATLRCQSFAKACDVNFGLDYYDSNGKYHSPLTSWNYNAGKAPINVDYDLSALAGQNVDFVLALRPNNDTPQQDIGLWIAPQIYRPNQ